MRKFQTIIHMQNGDRFKGVFNAKNHEHVVEQVKAKCFDPSQLESVFTQPMKYILQRN